MTVSNITICDGCGMSSSEDTTDVEKHGNTWSAVTINPHEHKGGYFNGDLCGACTAILWHALNDKRLRVVVNKGDKA